jgi:hypothetical protein
MILFKKLEVLRKFIIKMQEKIISTVDEYY